MRSFTSTLVFLALQVTSTFATNNRGSACRASLGNGSAGPNDPYWLGSIPHVGTAPFSPSPSTYKVFRNVKDYGAVGDGVTDDTAAINAAIADQARCGLGCGSTTKTPALVYFPSGKYLVSAPILAIYYTALVGDAKKRPTLIAAASFNGSAVIDADPVGPDGNSYYVNQVNFFRAVRNFNIDLRRMPSSSVATGIHWQVSQATSLSYVKVIMSEAPGTQHRGLLMENGSGGSMADLEFVGGKQSMTVGNQQFTVRNVKFTNAQLAIDAFWNWGWTFQNIEITNCTTGVRIENFGTAGEVFLDFTVKNTPTFIETRSNQPDSLVGSIYIDNAKLTKVPIVLRLIDGGTIVPGTNGTMTIGSWARGNLYSRDQSTPRYVQSNVTPVQKPAALLDSSGKIYGAGRPQYEKYSPSDFVSVKANGAVGDGVTDDTKALQKIIDKYYGCKIIFFDAGSYVISDTLKIPPGTDIVGEAWSQILIKGPKFNDVKNPRVALKFGQPGDCGTLRVSDLVISTYAGSIGAIVMEINIKASYQGSVGFWETHVRLGGAAGTGLTDKTCKKWEGHGIECSAAFLAVHITKDASAYMENIWLWAADHQLDDDPVGTQIDVFSGRGILVEGTNVWLVGTGSEHHSMYQYRLYGAKNVYAGLIQTETPYYQPVPAAPLPFTTKSQYHDPDVSSLGSALALSVDCSDSVYVYGAGLYSFFRNYTSTCLDTWTCQSQIVDVSSSSSHVNIFGLSTVGTTYQLSYDGQPIINQSSNRNGFVSTVTAWTSDSISPVSKEKREVGHHQHHHHRRSSHFVPEGLHGYSY